jgi:hypothetical protein
MTSRTRAVRSFSLLALPAAAVLAACDGPTGGYPPAPPAYVPPAEEMTKAAAPKFQPLIKALLAKKTDEAGKPLTPFAASRAASDALSAALQQAGLSDAERRTWDVITSLDDAGLEKLVK